MRIGIVICICISVFVAYAHHGLFIKLMGRCIPSYLLKTFECWFSKGLTCVRWGSTYSNFFLLNCGIRQGGVLSPYFFALYIDDIVNKVNKNYNLGCYIKGYCVSILFIYADDIIIIVPIALLALNSVFEKLGFPDNFFNIECSMHSSSARKKISPNTTE